MTATPSKSQLDVPQQIDAAKHRLATAKLSFKFASQMATSAAERMNAALAQLDAVNDQLQLVYAQLDEAKSNMELTNGEVARCQREVGDAETFLMGLEKRMGVQMDTWMETRMGGQMEVGKVSNDQAKLLEQFEEVLSSDIITRSIYESSPHLEMTATTASTSNGISSDKNDDKVAKDYDNYNSINKMIRKFKVSGCGIRSFNGTYRIQGANNDGVSMYHRKGTWNGKEVTFVLYRHKWAFTNNRLWFISILTNKKKPGSLNDIDFYCSPVCGEDDLEGKAGLLPPENNWRLIHEGIEPAPVVTAMSDSHSKSAEPRSTLYESTSFYCTTPDEEARQRESFQKTKRRASFDMTCSNENNNQRESFYKTNEQRSNLCNNQQSQKSDNENSPVVLVKGCGMSQINGTYKESKLLYDGVPIYCNGNYRLFRMQTTLSGKRRWYLSRIANQNSDGKPSDCSNDDDDVYYQSPIIISSSSVVEIPSGKWEAMEHGIHPAPHILQTNYYNKLWQRR